MMSDKSTNIQENMRGLSFSFRIARRYLFSKKSHNAINIISGISAGGVAIGAMALVCVLSVFNGFESLITTMFSSFDPDLKIVRSEGKSFRDDGPEFKHLRKLDAVAYYTEVVEDNALLRYKNKQLSATVKGVSDNFQKMSRIDSIIYDGSYMVFDGAFQRSVLGMGLAANLGVGAQFIDPIYMYAPKRSARVNLLRPENSFNQMPTFASGIFAVKQAQYDDHYVIVSLDFARSLFEYNEHTVTAVELKLKPNYDIDKAEKQIQAMLGEHFLVKNRYEQQESLFSIMKIEKWIAYLIISFILLIASFNIIGSLSMLIIDKKDDIETLRNLGADNVLIRRIFLFEGWMISALGAVFGIGLGIVLCLLQEYVGLIKLGDNYVVENYPVVTEWSDSALVFVTVLVMGFLAAWYPVRYIRRRENLNEV